MNPLRKLVAIIALCSLISCAAHVKQDLGLRLLTDPKAVSLDTKVKHDEYKKLTEYKGRSAVPHGSFFLRAFKSDGDGTTSFQIYVESVYTNAWRFYHDAYDSNGQKLEFTLINRNVDLCGSSSGCYFTETVGINVSRKYLEDKQDAGIRFKISGNAGEDVRFLPAAYVKGFLMSLDNT